MWQDRQAPLGHEKRKTAMNERREKKDNEFDRPFALVPVCLCVLTLTECWECSNAKTQAFQARKYIDTIKQSPRHFHLDVGLILYFSKHTYTLLSHRLRPFKAQFNPTHSLSMRLSTCLCDYTSVCDGSMSVCVWCIKLDPASLFQEWYTIELMTPTPHPPAIYPNPNKLQTAFPYF